MRCLFHAFVACLCSITNGIVVPSRRTTDLHSFLEKQEPYDEKMDRIMSGMDAAVEKETRSGNVMRNADAVEAAVGVSPQKMRKDSGPLHKYLQDAKSGVEKSEQGEAAETINADPSPKKSTEGGTIKKAIPKKTKVPGSVSSPTGISSKDNVPSEHKVDPRVQTDDVFQKDYPVDGEHDVTSAVGSSDAGMSAGESISVTTSTTTTTLSSEDAAMLAGAKRELVSAQDREAQAANVVAEHRATLQKKNSEADAAEEAFQKSDIAISDASRAARAAREKAERHSDKVDATAEDVEAKKAAFEQSKLDNQNALSQLDIATAHAETAAAELERRQKIFNDLMVTRQQSQVSVEEQAIRLELAQRELERAEEAALLAAQRLEDVQAQIKSGATTASVIPSFLLGAGLFLLWL
jgi:hypothetical protein